MDVFENAGRQPASVYPDAVLYGIPRMIVCESRTFMGEEALLGSHGVQVGVLQDATCPPLRELVAARPERWSEEIGVDD